MKNLYTSTCDQWSICLLVIKKNKFYCVVFAGRDTKIASIKITVQKFSYYRQYCRFPVRGCFPHLYTILVLSSILSLCVVFYASLRTRSRLRKQRWRTTLNKSRISIWSLRSVCKWSLTEMKSNGFLSLVFFCKLAGI